MLRKAVTFFFWLLLAAPLLAQEATISIDCGREHGEGEAAERDRLRGFSFSPDIRWRDGARYGFVGGRPRWDFFPWYAEGTHIPDVYRRRREGVKAYNFSLPAGNYILTLGLLERSAHCSGLRKFSVSVSGKTLIKDLDIFAVAGLDRACTYRFHIKHDGGVMAVGFSGGGKLGATVSLIEIKRRKPDKTAPVARLGVKAVPGFGENIIVWGATDEDDIAGCFVERAQGGGKFKRLNSSLLPVRIYVDRDVAVNTSYRYRVIAEDVFGNRGKPSRTVAATPLGKKTSLPVYKLTVKEEDLRRLSVNPAARVSVPAVFAHAGKRHEVKLRLRGASTRWLPKKGFKIVFSKSSPFGGRECINLKAQMGDATLQQEKLSLDLIGATRAASSQARHVHLRINGRFVGVYLEIEEIDESFLRRTGRSSDGLLYRAYSFQQLQNPRSYAETFRARTAAARNREPVMALIEFLNRATAGEFDRFADKYFNIEQVLDYLCILALLQRTEIEAGDYFLYRAPDTGLWEIFTWDNNNGNFGMWGFRNELHLEAEGSIFANSIYCVPPNNPYWHTIHTRFLHAPRLRERYLKRLRQMNAELLSSGKINRMIESNYNSIKQDACADWHKFPATNNTLFLRSAAALKDWARRRRKFVSCALKEARGKQAIVISEFLAYPDTSSDTPSLQRQWIELHNRSERTIRLDNFYLSNNLHKYRMWRFPEGQVLTPGKNMIVYAGGELSDDAPSTDFTLSSDGGEIGLFEIRDERLIVHDMVFYGRQNKEISYGRASSTAGDRGYFRNPTPGKRNPRKNIADHHIYSVSAESQGGKHLISAVVLGTPQDCKVSAIVKAGGEYSCAELKKAPNTEGTYSGSISLPEGVVAGYYVVARTKDGIAKTYPLTVPERKLYLLPHRPLESPVVINELMAANRTAVRSDRGEYCDWIELRNTSDKEVSTRGLYLTDDPSLSRLWPLPPDLKIPVKGYLLLWADGEPDHGRLHTDFRLSRNGETLYLLRRKDTGLYLLDKVTYPGLSNDQSYARGADGHSWRKTAKPSPGR
jgi:spore coat protein H